MSKAHLFSYNIFSNGVITGCTQYGDMSVSLNTTDTSGFTVGNMGNPYHGPDEDLGYVIAKASPARGRTHKRGTELAPDAVSFIRSDSKTDASFVDLVNKNFNQSFSLDSSGAVTAKNYLTTNEYWTSWSSMSTVTNGLLLNLDVGDSQSYPGSGTTWTDTIGNKTFTLFNNPTYSSNNGGYLLFTPSSSQYAASSDSLSSLSTWSVEVWHYYTGLNSGASPTILTELYPGSTSKINFNLGSTSNLGTTSLTNGFFNGSWRSTSATTLTANNWYHIVGTYDGTTIKLYVNNTLVQSSNYSGTPTSSNGGIRLMRRWDLDDYWGGRLSVVRIYTGDILATGVAQNWNAQKSRFGL